MGDSLDSLSNKIQPYVQSTNEQVMETMHGAARHLVLPQC